MLTVLLAQLFYMFVFGVVSLDVLGCHFISCISAWGCTSGVTEWYKSLYDLTGDLKDRPSADV